MADGTDAKILGLPRRLALCIGMVLLIGAALAIVLWGTTPKIWGETGEYQAVAVDLQDGSLAQLPGTALGYPIVLLTTGATTTPGWPLFALQLLLHLSAVWIVIVLAQRFQLPFAGSLVLAALLVSPPLMLKVSEAMTETCTEFFLVLTAWFFVLWVERRKARYAVLAGFATAFAAYMRPTYQMFGLVMAGFAFMWLWQQRERAQAWRAALLLMVGSFVLIGGMTLFNATMFNYPAYTTHMGWNLTAKTALFVEHLPDDEPVKPILVAARNESLRVNPTGRAVNYAFWPHPVFAEAQEAVGGGRSDIMKHMLWVNLRLIANRPAEYAESVLSSVGTYVLPSGTGIEADGGPVVRMAYVAAHFSIAIGFFVQVFLIAGLAIAKRLGADVQGPINQPSMMPTWWIAMLIVVFTAVISTMLGSGIPRYRTSTDVFILLLVFGGLYAGYQGIWKRAPA